MVWLHVFVWSALPHPWPRKFCIEYVSINPEILVAVILLKIDLTVNQPFDLAQEYSR